MKNANHFFGSHNGPENFFCHKPSLILYTDGVKELAEGCGAYWLIDLIISHQCHRDINLERFQVWDLKRVKDNAFTRIERPNRIQKARRLGYKAKQGMVVIRTRVGTGGMRRQRPVAGRRPKHLGVTRIKADVNMQQVAEKRTQQRYKNLKLLGSYFLYKDGFHYWFEVILADPSHPRISKDKELRKRVIPA